jgi:hypothetical protein
MRPEHFVPQSKPVEEEPRRPVKVKEKPKAPPMITKKATTTRFKRKPTSRVSMGKSRMRFDDDLTDISKSATTAKSPAKRMIIRTTANKKPRVEPTGTNEIRVNIPHPPSDTVQSEPVSVDVRSEPVQLQRGDFSVS